MESGNEILIERNICAQELLAFQANPRKVQHKINFNYSFENLKGLYKKNQLQLRRSLYQIRKKHFVSAREHFN